VSELGRFRSAFFTNSSCAIAPLASIDEVHFAPDDGLAMLLERALATQPWQPL
jgi:4-amino-4-deoxychorismate lyase